MESAGVRVPRSFFIKIRKCSIT